MVALRIADSIEDQQVKASDRLDLAAGEVLSELSRVAAVLRPLRADEAQDLTEARPAAPHARWDPAPVDGLVLADAGDADLAELLVLQRCCWVDEARANKTLEIAALRETADDVRAWASTWQVWCVRRHGRLVAAVRARAQGSTWEIGRLMVAPDLAGRGIGRWLLARTERQAPAGTAQYSLSTGESSVRNIGMYERAGYRVRPTAGESDGSVHLTKPAVTLDDSKAS
jgi:GNAT superfamily N-acetyltransferase